MLLDAVQQIELREIELALLFRRRMASQAVLSQERVNGRAKFIRSGHRESRIEK
jgi:hypothetical protein